MTKLVRIENADTTAHKVVVEVWQKGAGHGPDATRPAESDVLIETRELTNPADMLALSIWRNRYLVVREAT